MPVHLRVWIAVLAPLAAAGGGCAPAAGATAAQEPAPAVTVRSDYGRKVVYGTAPDEPVERLRADCARRGGTFDTCGTTCPPEADLCAQVCAFTCERIPAAPDGGSAGGARGAVALLDTRPPAAGPTHGCDAVSTVERSLPAAGSDAEARLRALFAIEEAWVDGLYNFIARTRSTLHLERVEVGDGTARVYLTGRVSGFSGACDHPRARIQIEETALRARGVQRVRILLNGEPSDLQPDGRGTPR